MNSDEGKQTPVLQLKQLNKSYRLKDGRTLRSVRDMDLFINRGECLAVVGESGCGKSTLARLILHLEPPDSGKIFYNGVQVNHLKKHDFQEYRRQVQMVFQDPAGVFSPRMKIGRFLMEPWLNYEKKSRREAKEMAVYALKRFGLPESYIEKYPHQLSGGELQRVAIARAIAIHPQLLICDEATSALDVSVQKQVIGLLREHQKEAGISILFISHDLALAENLGDRIAVMYLGEIVELMGGRHLRLNAKHPYTQALLNSVFSLHDEPNAEISTLDGEPPDPADEYPGCTFCQRCSRAEPECSRKRPQLMEVEPGHWAACFALLKPMV